jgi:predicted metal-dependent peptidase
MGLANKELKAVLIHEALHVLLHHIARSEFFSYNHKGFNIAADVAINCHISDLPEGCLYPKTFGLEDFQASEWYYEKLKDQADKAGGMDGLLDGKGDLVDDHGMWGDCEGDVIKEKIRGIADRAIKNQDEKGWSGVSDGIAKAVLEANKPVVNWKRELRYFINKLISSGSKSTRTRINRREQWSKKNRKDALRNVYIQPGKKRDYTSKLLVAVDTSGSVSDEELRIFLGEVNGMSEHVQCHVVCFDTQIHGEPVQISKKIRNYEFKGRGGTDFHPIMTYVDEHTYDGLIMLTDGYAPFPPQPKARVLWALSTQGASVHPPYGKRLVIDTKKC